MQQQDAMPVQDGDQVRQGPRFIFRSSMFSMVMVVLPVLAGCASLLQLRASRPEPAVYAVDDATPGDIYRSWYLYRQIDGSSSVAGQLALADLTNWRPDRFRSAFYWYTRAAASGDGVAAANLWYMYETMPGGGLELQAITFYRLAATSETGRHQLFALETKLAIDSARRYPPAAGTAGEGTAIIEFDRGADDRATDVKVYRSSGSPEVDTAAVEAVENATLPAVPPGLADIHHFVISVTIRPDVT